MSKGYIIKIGNLYYLADDMLDTSEVENNLNVTEKLREAHIFKHDAVGCGLAWRNRDLIWDYQDKGHGLFGMEIAIEVYEREVALLLDRADNI